MANYSNLLFWLLLIQSRQEDIGTVSKGKCRHNRGSKIGVSEVREGYDGGGSSVLTAWLRLCKVF